MKKRREAGRHHNEIYDEGARASTKRMNSEGKNEKEGGMKNVKKKTREREREDRKQQEKYAKAKNITRGPSYDVP